jgi:hypothetical protein
MYGILHKVKFFNRKIKLSSFSYVIFLYKVGY